MVDAIVDEFTAAWGGAADDGAIDAEALNDGITWAEAFNEQVESAVALTRALIWSMLYTLLVFLTVAALIAQGCKEQAAKKKKVTYSLKDFCISPCGMTREQCDEPMKLIVHSTRVQPTTTTEKCIELQKVSSDEETYEIDTDEDDDGEDESRRHFGDRSIFRTLQEKHDSPALVEFSNEMGSGETIEPEEASQMPTPSMDQAEKEEPEQRSPVQNDSNNFQKELDFAKEENVEVMEPDRKAVSLEVAGPDVVRSRSMFRAEGKDTREIGILKQMATAGEMETTHIQQYGMEGKNDGNESQKGFQSKAEDSVSRENNPMDLKDAALNGVRRRSVFFGTRQNLKDAIGTQKLEGNTAAQTIPQEQESGIQERGKELHPRLGSKKENRTSTHEDLRPLKDSISVLQKLLQDAKEAA